MWVMQSDVAREERSWSVSSSLAGNLANLSCLKLSSKLL